MTEKPQERRPGIDVETNRIKFDYIKSNYFRVVHVDGVFGGIGISGLPSIHMTVWNERWPLPKQTTFNLKPDGTLGSEVAEERISRDAIVREAEAHLIMSLDVAKQMRTWLDTKIASFEKALGCEKDTKESTEGGHDGVH